LPDLFESGTPNGVGIAGLKAGVEFVLRRGVENIHHQEISLAERLGEGLREIPGTELFGPKGKGTRMPIVSFRLSQQSPSKVASRLEKGFGILCRPGLHCAPAAHRTIGTFPEGTVRFSLSVFSSEAEIDTALRAVSAVSQEM
jgi:selenocysteine lyase/cysteine desulfurase